MANFSGWSRKGRCLVEYLGAFTLGLAKQMGGVKVLAVKGRVFAHDDGVKVFEPCLALGCDFIPSTRIASQVASLEPAL